MLSTLSFILVATSIAYASDNHMTHWGYEVDNGPEVWGNLGYETCKIGTTQSPVNIIAKNAKTTKNELNIAYKPSSASLVNNGHTIQANFDDSGDVVFEGKAYKLIQTHFHTPSENQLNGKKYPLEAHFVHKTKDGAILVLAVLFEKGAANMELNKISIATPKEVGIVLDINDFNPDKLLPTKHGYYAFTGSLTTPPCTEKVQWVVLKAQQTASEKQIANLHMVMKDNARQPQMLNDRLVKVAE